MKKRIPFPNKGLTRERSLDKLRERRAKLRKRGMKETLRREASLEYQVFSFLRMREWKSLASIVASMKSWARDRGLPEGSVSRKTVKGILLDFEEKGLVIKIRNAWDWTYRRKPGSRFQILENANK